MVHRQRLYKDEVSEFCIGERIVPKLQEAHTALTKIVSMKKISKEEKTMRLNLFKSKFLTGALALAMTVAMVPNMAMAEDTDITNVDSQAAEVTAERVEQPEAEAVTENLNPIVATQAFISVMGPNGNNIAMGRNPNVGNSNVYQVLTQLLDAQNIPYDITTEKINSINGIGPATTGGEKPAWFFAVNQKLAQRSIGNEPFKDGDILRVFYVKNADTARMGYVEPIGAMGSYLLQNNVFEEKNATFVYANANEPIALQMMSVSLNFKNLSVKRESNFDITVGNTPTNFIDVTLQNDQGANIGKWFSVGEVTGDKVLKLAGEANLGYELIPAYIGLQTVPETIAGINFLSACDNWFESSMERLVMQDWAADDTEYAFYGTTPGLKTYNTYNYIETLIHRDIFNNDMKLTGLAFKNSEGEYLDMVQKDDPLSGFAPYKTEYSLGNTPDSITLEYEHLGTRLVVNVTVPEGVVYNPTTKNISDLQDKKGNIKIEVKNTETDRGAMYTVAFDNQTVPQVDFAAYLPGYGQFVNEHINAGGWGDAYVVGSTARKNMLNNMEQTGVSLGSFGGYAIFDFGTNGVANDPNNKYGVDFIVYGNAFVGNAEPGGIQVSQDGATWYNIAGSRHYADSTVWDYTVTHTNPTPADDNENLVNPKGQLPATNHIFPTISKARPESAEQPGTFTMTHNTWHDHSWYPLFGNYFKSRKAGDLPLANLERASAFATYTPKTSTAASKLELKGTKIDFTSMSGNDYTFGYCDVHPNGNTPGVASNPYTAVASTAGGDGIDISWAVNANGEPVNLDNIRYVRIYTGVMNDNPPFGETSTEVTGVYNVTPQAAAVGVTDAPVVKKEFSTLVHQNGGIQTVATKPNGQINLKLTSQSENVYVNGVKVNASGSGYQINMTLNPQEVKYLQVIAQTGDKEPYVTVFKIVRN